MDLPSQLFGPRDPTLAPQGPPDPTTGLTFEDFLMALQRTFGQGITDYSGAQGVMPNGPPPSRRSRDKPGNRPGDYLGRDSGKPGKERRPAPAPNGGMLPGFVRPNTASPTDGLGIPPLLGPQWSGATPPPVAGVPYEPQPPHPGMAYDPSMPPGMAGAAPPASTGTPAPQMGPGPFGPGMPAPTPADRPGQTGPFVPGMTGMPVSATAPPRPGAPPARPPGIENYFAPMLSDAELRRIFAEGPYDMRAK